MEKILQCQHLTYFYKEHVGIHDISFDLVSGVALGLVGESGSGKSTIAQLICKFLNMQQGDILLLDKNFKAYDDKSYYKQVQYIPQNPREFFHPKRTIRKSFLEVLNNFNVDDKANREEIVKNALIEVGLNENHLDMFPDRLSGGECQRMSIAMALALKPSVIICDEITSALDVTIQAEIMKLLQQIKQKYHATFLFISHDIALVSQFCESIIVLKDGQIVEQGDTLAVVNHPQQDYTKLLLDEYGQF